MTFALTLPPFIMLLGLGIDFLVAYSDKSRVDAAGDSAAIAAVNAAKTFYAANAKTMSGTALVNASIAAGVAQGQMAFKANMGSTDLASSATPTINLTFSSLVFTANVTWTGSTANHFGPMVGVPYFQLSVTSSATSSLPKYEDFYIVTDVSGSMGIPPDAADQQTLMANNPDNAWGRSAGYYGGCQFACHFPGFSGYNYAKANGIPLKLDSVGQSIQSLLSTATSSEVIANQYRVGIYTFIVNAIQAAPLSSDFTDANSVSENLGSYVDGGTSNQGMGSGGTHFENLWNDMKPYLQTPGPGTSQSSPLPFIILVTDGVDNNQTYSPWTGSQPQLPPTTFCSNAKAAGYTVAVLLVTYADIADPEPGFANNEDIVTNDMLDNGSVTATMKSCASTGYFYQASSTAAINSAMQQIFAQATALTRLTQ